jgi:hypothetical protein
MLDTFRLVDHEGVEEKNVIIDEIAVKDFRRKNRKSVLAQATNKFDETESPRKMGIFAPREPRQRKSSEPCSSPSLMYVT